jgi:C4-type Zn-finger protein
LGYEALENVEDFVTNRNDSEAKRQEATLILEIQDDMGLNFVEGKEALVEHLVELEERDREKLARFEKSQGLQ